MGIAITRALKWSREHLYQVLVLVGITAMVLGFVGFRQYHSLNADLGHYDVGSTIWRSAQLFVWESGALPGQVPVALQIARILAPLATLGAVLALGREYLERRYSLWRARRRAGHVVVCGIGRKGHGLIRSLAEAHGRRGVVAIDRDSSNTAIAELRDAGVPVLVGDSRDPHVLRSAGVKKARHVFVLCGTDTSNAEVALAVKSAMAESDVRASCSVHVSDPRLTEMLRRHELESPSPSVSMEYFNINDAAASNLVHTYLGDSRAGRSCSFVVVGEGLLAEALIVHAAKHHQTPPGESGPRYEILVLAPRAEAFVQILRTRYRRIEEQVALTPVDVPLQNGRLALGGAEAAIVDAVPPSIAYVCTDDDNLAVLTSLELASLRSWSDAEIVCCVRDEVGITQIFGQLADVSGPRNRVVVHDVYEVLSHPDTALGGVWEQIAERIHSSYLAGQLGAGEQYGSRPELVSWTELGVADKESNREQARHIGVKLKTIDCSITSLLDWEPSSFEFTPGEVEILAEMEHERWCAWKTAQGWTYGAERDRVRLHHEALLPWSHPDFSEEQRDKDRDAVLSIPALLASVGYRAFRRDGGDSGGHQEVHDSAQQ
ncbi:MAG: NAD-binding protein [Armatimonadetes bacterium]|nr:NAD-binding protein [Armatimonadota bacterium]